jgi:hypothetical protein
MPQRDPPRAFAARFSGEHWPELQHLSPQGFVKFLKRMMKKYVGPLASSPAGFALVPLRLVRSATSIATKLVVASTIGRKTSISLFGVESELCSGNSAQSTGKSVAIKMRRSIPSKLLGMTPLSRDSLYPAITTF